jgi:putative phosphoesterase
MNLGIISDTHGTVTPQALSALKGSDRILHAGDITTPDVIQALKTLAPVIAVRGNMDYGATASNLPPAEMLEFDGTCIYMLHNLHTLDLDPKAAGIHIVIHGHTHQADMKTIDTVLYFNPGSASHGRYGSPPSVGQIHLTNGNIIPRIIALKY